MILVLLRLKQIRLVLNGKEINLTADNTIIKSNNFNVNKNGDITCNNATCNNMNVENGRIKLSGWGNLYLVDNSEQIQTSVDPGEITLYNTPKNSIRINSEVGITVVAPEGESFIGGEEISTSKFTQTSLEERKKNFEKFQNNALDIIKNIDIYKYNLKSEKDTDKKHLGFVIGDNYNYSEEVTSIDNKGVDIYSFASLCCVAIQEQQKQLEQLQERDKQKDKIIADLIKRIEILEKGANK